MPTTTLTTKGQMVLPAEVRRRLGLKPGDRFDVAIQDDSIVLTPMTLHWDDLIDLLPRPKRSATIEEINEAIAQGAQEGAA